MGIMDIGLHNHVILEIMRIGKNTALSFFHDEVFKCTA